MEEEGGNKGPPLKVNPFVSQGDNCQSVHNIDRRISWRKGVKSGKTISDS